MKFPFYRMRLKQIHGVAVENLPTADGQNFDPAKFELLLNHRKMELQGNQSLMPFLGGFNPAALGLGLAARDGADVAGLDLRFKTIDDDLEEEISDTASDRKDGDDEKNEEQKSPNPRSRRKPAAPQWVNPEWEEGSGKFLEINKTQILIFNSDIFQVVHKIIQTQGKNQLMEFVSETLQLLVKKTLLLQKKHQKT